MKSKIVMSEKMREYLRIVNERYTEKCLKQKNWNIIYVGNKCTNNQFNKPI